MRGQGEHYLDPREREEPAVVIHWRLWVAGSAMEEAPLLAPRCTPCPKPPSLALQKHPQPFLCTTNSPPHPAHLRLYSRHGPPSAGDTNPCGKAYGVTAKTPSLSSPRPLRRPHFCERGHALIRKTHSYAGAGAAPLRVCWMMELRIVVFPDLIFSPWPGLPPSFPGLGGRGERSQPRGQHTGDTAQGKGTELPSTSHAVSKPASLPRSRFRYHHMFSLFSCQYPPSPYPSGSRGSQVCGFSSKLEFS